MRPTWASCGFIAPCLALVRTGQPFHPNYPGTSTFLHPRIYWMGIVSILLPTISGCVSRHRDCSAWTEEFPQKDSETCPLARATFPRVLRTEIRVLFPEILNARLFQPRILSDKWSNCSMNNHENEPLLMYYEFCRDLFRSSQMKKKKGKSVKHLIFH